MSSLINVLICFEISDAEGNEEDDEDDGVDVDCFFFDDDVDDDRGLAVIVLTSLFLSLLLFLCPFRSVSDYLSEVCTRSPSTMMLLQFGCLRLGSRKKDGWRLEIVSNRLAVGVDHLLVGKCMQTSPLSPLPPFRPPKTKPFPPFLLRGRIHVVATTS